MPNHPPAVRTIVWGQPDQERLIREAAACAKLEIMAAGSDASHPTADLAHLLKVERLAEMRQALHRGDIQLLWLADPEPLSADELALLRESGLHTVASEPQFGTITELSAELPAAGFPAFVPRMRHSPGFRAAGEVMDQFGPAQCVNVFFRSGPGQGTLFARLYDAMDVIASLCDHTEAINAALAGPLAMAPEHLPNLRGHLTVNMRFKSNRCACAALSDRAGSWFRGLTILGEGGCMRISDGGFDWIGPDGNIIDSQYSHHSLSAGELVGLQIARLLDVRNATEPPPDNASLLALCEAARLSSLTGQDESPGKVMEMLSHP